MRSSLTVDAPVLGSRERDLRTGFAIPSELRVAVARSWRPHAARGVREISPSLTWRDLERIASTPACRCSSRGCSPPRTRGSPASTARPAIVVSNHGGRQLDGVAATIDALPEVVDAVDGRVEVLVDGGIRRGTDVVKALALGARAVLAGRAPLWGLAVDGEAGRATCCESCRRRF